MTHTIDAKGKTLGRLSSEVARLLQGKNAASYNPRVLGENKIVIKNVKSLKLTGKKESQKVYYRHTGYVGHLKEKKFEDVFSSNPGWVLKRAVRGMLPKNKLASKRLKMLVIEDNE
ncbi:MAG: 50S ribosomal protein L13 [Patescibacteria group bacterium]|nr:50S ribosomal protein L13 [Patescibacteria group bacterium]MDE2144642.1 50S ribosomal protein L13 [Patescibacteria group bacterium]